MAASSDTAISLHKHTSSQTLTLQIWWLHKYLHELIIFVPLWAALWTSPWTLGSPTHFSISGSSRKWLFLHLSSCSLPDHHYPRSSHTCTSSISYINHPHLCIIYSGSVFLTQCRLTQKWMEIQHLTTIRAQPSEQILISLRIILRSKNYKTQSFQDPSQERHTHYEAIRICVFLPYFNVATKLLLLIPNSKSKISQTDLKYLRLSRGKKFKIIYIYV